MKQSPAPFTVVMPRVVALAILLVSTAAGAAAQDGARSIPSSENIPVPGGIEALARALDIEPPLRAVVVPTLARYLYRAPDRQGEDVGRRRRFTQYLQQAVPAAPADLVPLPLDAATWAQAILRRQVEPHALFAAIMSDRPAALMAYGLSWLDDPTLEFLSRHPALLSRLTERSAPEFATYARSLHIALGRIVVPGGDESVPLWEAVVGERVDRPEPFVERLFEQRKGRLAYLYDAIASLDEPRARFALGTWIADPAARRERFLALAEAAANLFPEFDSALRTLSRPTDDLSALLARLTVAPDGTPAPPSDRALWRRVFEALAGRTVEPSKRGTDAPREGPVDAAWLASQILTRTMSDRRERIDAVVFAQRAFRNVAHGTFDDLVFALGGFGRFEALPLTLDRMKISDPAIYAAAQRRATALSDLDRAPMFAAIAQFQSALAVIAELRRSRTVDFLGGQRLVESLIAVDASGGGYRCGLAAWIDAALLPSLPNGGDGGVSIEGRVLSAMSGRISTPAPGRPVTWEGEVYRMDLAGAEMRRLAHVRSKKSGPTLDDVKALARDVRRLTSPDGGAAALPDVEALAAALARHAGLFDRESAAVLSDTLEALRRVRTRDAKTVASRAAALASLCDAALARVLMSLAYAKHLGDGNGTVLLGGDVSGRHDFGLDLAVGDRRRRTPWQIPVPQIVPGAPWHVLGSVLALDIGLSSLSLRQVTAGTVPAHLAAIRDGDRKAFSDGVALLDPLDLTDDSRDRIVAALARGRARVTRLQEFPSELQTILTDVRSLRVDGLRQRAIRWTLANENTGVSGWVSLSELAVLGGAEGDLHAWGMSGVPLDACLCTRLLAQEAWQLFTGQLNAGTLPVRIADLNLRVAEVSAALNVPAALSRGILEGAVLDYLDDVRPLDSDDWLAFVRAAPRVSRERIEDYTAALTSNGMLVPATAGREESRQ